MAHLYSLPQKISTALAVALVSVTASAQADWGVSRMGDELGNARALGPATWARCAEHLAAPGDRKSVV